MTVFYRDKYVVLYVHVPKTGGGFILDTFMQNGFKAEFLDTSNIISGFNRVRTCSPQHYHAELLQQTLRLGKINYSFMTVRHPLDRLKSEFLWRVRDPAVDPNAWARHVMSKYQSDPFFLDNHIRPQRDFILPGADIFRTEDGLGEAWLAAVNARTGLDLQVLPDVRANASKAITGRSVDSVVFNDDTRKRIEDFYRADYTQFQYPVG